MATGSPNPYRTRPPRGGRTGRNRRGARALLPLGVAAWALLEIWLLILVGEAAGGLTVFLLLAAGVVVGGSVIRLAGRRAWRRLSATLQPGHAPGADREPAPDRERRGGTGLAMLGGLLLMVPGLLSDAVGLLCVFPPTAALLRRAGTRAGVRLLGVPPEVFEQARRAEEQRRTRRTDDDRVVPGEVVREDRDEPDRPDRDNG
ncbi:FxsA family membrane protein [Streptomyces sp. B6B3]|uniref:FxsA family membrane protein n=1 Tax=Streptomyces sp. B6B3 TaxID=3153570 RepID=UPI00325F7194